MMHDSEVERDARESGERSDPGSLQTPTHTLLRAGAAPLERGELIDRYVIMSLLGAGGMGVVHAAYDPDLDRKVALKLLRRDRYPSAAASRRLLREAQALARLAHPNVVAIHDVGTHIGQVWLAMEFVSGQTLRAWLASRARGWREIFDVVYAAGQGIAAAHRQGLLHRDIKPDNIMVAEDGRVRAMDFGLARLTESASESASDLDVNFVTATTGGSCLTGQGMLVGTPAYLAPELLLGANSDARSDQFSFCVTLWEALYGERPYVWDLETSPELAIAEGRRRPPPRGARVPAWLRRACERGLASDPDARWPSMDALLDGLGGGQAQTRRRGFAWGLGVIGLGVGLFAGWHQLEQASERRACAKIGAEIEQTWNPDVRAQLELALRESGAANAGATLERVLPRLDVWATQWSTLREQACVESMLEGSLAPALAAASSECFADQRDLLAGVLDVLSEGDRAALERAVPATAGLPPLTRCLDSRALERQPTPSRDPRYQARLDIQRRALMRLRGRLAIGDYDAGFVAAQALLTEVEALDALMLATSTRSTLGELARLSGRYDHAEQIWRQAFLDAGTLRDEQLAADLALRLAIVIGVDLARPAEGLAWTDAAEMLLRHLDDDESVLEGGLVVTRAHLQLRQGKHEAAERGYTRALELAKSNYGAEHAKLAEALNGLATTFEVRGEFETAADYFNQALAARERSLGPDHPAVAASLHNLGLLRWRQGDSEAARAAFERSLAIWKDSAGPESSDAAMAINSLALLDKTMGRYTEAEAGFEHALSIRERTLGRDHNLVAETLNALAGIDRMRGDYEAAQQRYQRVLELWEASLGPEHPNLAGICNNLGELHRTRGQFERARELHTRALGIRERSLSADDPDIAESLSNLALLATHDGEHERARALNLRALGIRERSYGADHSAVAISLNNLAEIELELGALDDAEAHYARALEIFEARLGAEHLHVSYPLHGLAEVALARGHADQAVELLERALALREAKGAGPSDRAELRFALAGALWARGDRLRARSVATLARDEYREAERDELMSEIDTWLSAR